MSARLLSRFGQPSFFFWPPLFLLVCAPHTLPGSYRFPRAQPLPPSSAHLGGHFRRAIQIICACPPPPRYTSSYRDCWPPPATFPSGAAPRYSRAISKQIVLGTQRPLPSSIPPSVAKDQIPRKVRLSINPYDETAKSAASGGKDSRRNSEIRAMPLLLPK